MSSSTTRMTPDESHLAKSLRGRHIAVTNEADGKQYNAFVLEGSSVDSKLGRSAKDTHHVQIDVPVSFIVLKFNTDVDISTLNADVGLSFTMPLSSDIQVADQQGNLRDGITFSISYKSSILDILSVLGQVALSIGDDQWFHVKLEPLTVGDTVFNADLPVFPIPWSSKDIQ